jgi:ribosomal protein L7Ae-like RNA K-turn-binding protein
MKNIYPAIAAGILTFGLAFGASAQTTAGQDMKNAGSETKDAAKDTGRGIKKGTVKTGKAIKHGTKKGVHKAAGATENGADKLKDKTQ